MDRAIFGRWAERRAAQFLDERGYTLIAQNYRKPWGEIDIIVQKDTVLVFVEVKANATQYEGFEPELRANADKQRKIIRTARTFLAERRYPDTQEWQIDVIAVTLLGQKGTALIKHFKNI